jgi:exonuclease SbcC
VAAARREKQEALDEKETRVKELPRPAEAEEVAAQIEGQREAVAGIEATVDDLAEAPEKADQIAEELEALGDPRREYQRAADIAARRDEVEEALDDAQQQVGELSDEIGELEEELAAYEGLDEKVEAQRETAGEHEDAHQRYLAHVREAEALEERREKVATREEDLEAARAERDRLAGERDQMAAGYDADAYEELTATCDDLRSEVATLEERIRQQRSRFDDLQAEIERLTAVEAELDEARAERDELEDLLSLLEYLRQVLRDAGPKVTEALVEVISLQAARLYADIMADHSARLHWAEDYEIMLRSDGRERGFQQLSGGEQMAAALAVRLALLKEVSAVDLAFFDEPTANLDDRRRDNLAEQILDVKGFSQLFVISHDDTFEQDTDHVVRVVKDDEGSQVQMA